MNVQRNVMDNYAPTGAENARRGNVKGSPSIPMIPKKKKKTKAKPSPAPSRKGPRSTRSRINAYVPGCVGLYRDPPKTPTFGWQSGVPPPGSQDVSQQVPRADYSGNTEELTLKTWEDNPAKVQEYLDKHGPIGDLKPIPRMPCKAQPRPVPRQLTGEELARMGQTVSSSDRPVYRPTTDAEHDEVQKGFEKAWVAQRAARVAANRKSRRTIPNPKPLSEENEIALDVQTSRR
jgi:hypothetical protein